MVKATKADFEEVATSRLEGKTLASYAPVDGAALRSGRADGVSVREKPIQ